jgi:hypothetical protein
MGVFESKTRSFIVKIWLEDADGAEGARWRGHITHVLDGKRLYFESLDQILAFIGPYVNEMVDEA